MIMCDSEKMGLPLPPSNEWMQNMMMINSSMTTTPTAAAAAATTTTSSSSSGSKVAMVMAHQDPLKCPRCDSSNTKFCYYNNYSLAQPRHFCKACKRYWTRGGTLRNVPVGGGCRKNKRVKKHQPAAAAAPPVLPPTASSNTTPTAIASSAMAGSTTLQQTSQIRTAASSDLVTSFFYGSDMNQLGSNYATFHPQFSALGFNSNILSNIQASSTITDHYNPSELANYENNLANNFGLVKGVKMEGAENPNAVEHSSWQVMNPFDQNFSVDANTNNNYLYWSSADPTTSSLAPLI